MEILTEEQAADFLMMPKRTLQDMRRNGQIVYIQQSPKIVRYDKKDLINFLEDRKCQGESQNYKSENLNMGTHGRLFGTKNQKNAGSHALQMIMPKQRRVTKRSCKNGIGNIVLLPTQQNA